VSWCSDGWRAYPKAITRSYRRVVRTGRRGRPPLRVPEGLSLRQTIKHRDEHGRLLSVETRTAIDAAPAEQPVPVHIERLNGVLRDRLAILTRKTHAFAKSTWTWDALFGLALFEHDWLRPHPALSQPSTVPGRRYERRLASDGYWLGWPLLVVAGVSDHKGYCQLFRESLPIIPPRSESSRCVRAIPIRCLQGKKRGARCQPRRKAVSGIIHWARQTERAGRSTSRVGQNSADSRLLRWW
jgi:IS1 family transposase